MDEPLCPKATLSGYTVDGTFQQYCIGKAAHVARIPKDVPLDAIAVSTIQIDPTHGTADIYP